jgi:quercetin dioxygenase-like cupin family protein
MRTKAISVAMMMVAGVAFAQEPGGTPAKPEHAATGTQPGHAVFKPEQGQWMPFPDVFPKGATMKVMNGDPARGAADMYMKFPAKYAVPWHFHSAFERIYVDKGAMKFEHLDGTSTTLTEGGFMALPSRMAHKVTCVSDQECTLFLSTDGLFDIHLIDKTGKVTKSWSAASMAKPSNGQMPPR